MSKLFDSLLQVIAALWDLVITSLGVLAPWTPLVAWVAFWLLAVNWVKLRETLAKGGWIGVFLIGAIAVLIWGNIAPGSGGYDFFGLKISNFAEKTVYVSGLVCIMFLAGALQLSGFCSKLCQFEEPILIAESHGHGDHGHGGHDDHRHGASHDHHD